MCEIAGPNSIENRKKVALMKHLLVSLVLLQCYPARATTYFVSAIGSDSNAGTQAQPFRTIQRAADLVSPGDRVIVNDGTYRGSSSNTTPIVTINRGGNARNYVIFQSANKWGAKLDGQNRLSVGVAFGKGVSYVRIQNFEIYGIATGAPGGAGGIDLENAGGFIDIAGNNFHDIGKICTDSAYGQDAIFGATTHDIIIEQNFIHDIGRFAPGENGCTPLTGYYQNHDHGIYIASGSRYTIQNNIFYNNARGWSIQLYPHALSHIAIVNNTFAAPNPYREGQILVGAAIASSVISNNIFYQPTIAGIDFDVVTGFQDLTISNNLSTNELYVYKRTPTGVSYVKNRTNRAAVTVLADPGVDFHLKTGSPAIGAGEPTNAPASDYDGVTRSNPPCIGAYERAGSAK
jgi:parallel beta-helix repeat protein